MGQRVMIGGKRDMRMCSVMHEREERAVGERERKERGCGKGREKGTVIMDC